MNEILVYNMYFIAEIGFTQIFLIKDVYTTTHSLIFTGKVVRRFARVGAMHMYPTR